MRYSWYDGEYQLTMRWGGDSDLLFTLAYVTWVNMQYGDWNAENCAINNSPLCYARDRYASVKSQETRGFVLAMDYSLHRAFTSTPMVKFECWHKVQ